VRAPDSCVPLRAEGLRYAADGVAILRDVLFALKRGIEGEPLVFRNVDRPGT
jgi:hypothetical protein